MKLKLLVLLVSLVQILNNSHLLAQNIDTLDNLNLEELMKISIASGKSQSQEKAPSIVSVVTAKEIRTFGYRDLSDVLRSLPGFDFGIDVLGLTGISFRGIWAHEGKCLLQINGMMINDQAFGNFSYFNALPASMIEKVEVIRGPGSALYGGFAEVAVINVITTNQKPANGVTAKITSQAGVMGTSGITRGFGATINYAGEDSFLSAAVGRNVGYLGTKTYEDYNHNLLPFDAEASLRTYDYMVLAGRVKNLSVSAHHTQMKFSGQDGFTDILPKQFGQWRERVANYSDVVNVAYDFKIGKAFKITPSFNFNQTSPVSMGVIPNTVMSQSFPANAKTNRTTGELKTFFEKDRLSILSAAGYIRNNASGYDERTGKGLFFNDSRTDTATSTSTYQWYLLTQLDYSFANGVAFTSGLRYENTTFGSAYAPRLGLTYSKQKLSFKLLYGRSFRIPTPVNYSYLMFSAPTTRLSPETTVSLEGEVGYKVSAEWTLKLNAFRMSVDKPISYLSSTNSYENFGNISTQGIEFEAKYTGRSVGAFGNLTYLTPVSGTSATYLNQTGNKLLGYSPFKINAGLNIMLGKFEIVPSLTTFSKRPAAQQDLATTYDINSVLLANLNVNYKVKERLDLSLRGFNLLDADYYLVQPYYGGHAPLPVLNRSFQFVLTFEL